MVAMIMQTQTLFCMQTWTWSMNAQGERMVLELVIYYSFLSTFSVILLEIFIPLAVFNGHCLREVIRKSDI